MSFINAMRRNRAESFMDVSPPWEGQLVSGLTPSPYFRWKGILDRVLAAILLIPVLPMIGVLVLLVRMTSRGPGIYRQTRVGKDGRLFEMRKIRTMTHDAEADTGAVWTREDDPRITPVGRALRELHLDELPQLFNVLRGEMSLVGPRPERPEFVEVLAKRIPNYHDRFAVLPGVTGLAQINLDPDTDLKSVYHKLILDREYIKHAGILLDTRMLLCTFLYMLGLKGRYAKRITGLQREVPPLDGYLLPIGGNGTPSRDTPATPANIAGGTAKDLTEADEMVPPGLTIRIQSNSEARGQPDAPARSKTQKTGS